MSTSEYSADPESLLRILKRLRSPEDGCPWDRKQTRSSLARHLAEECGELIDAIDRNHAPDICEELGDVLMNLFFQIVVAEEQGDFAYQDVWRTIVDKMIRRHVHIFGDAHAASAEEVAQLWQQVKASEHPEKKSGSHLDKVKYSLSALSRAEALQKAAAVTGFDWENDLDILDKIKEETAEVSQAMVQNDGDQIDEELGDLLFAVVNLVRFRNGRSSEELLRRASMKFETRFRSLENLLGDSLENADPEQLNAAWEQVKAEEKNTYA